MFDHLIKCVRAKFWMRFEYHVPWSGIHLRVDVNVLTRRAYWECAIPAHMLELERERRIAEICALRLN